MIRGIAFQTKARTVDHLGREQIADCPTAISEIWKNAFDAYARRVNLGIFGGPNPVAVISDDGHGMNRTEFETRWLVVGTESKANGTVTPLEDRNGLYLRPRQGQKGIGRLSCANLGPVLLFISKRRRADFVVALVDWRLFENPFLNLSDVFIPVAEVATKEEIFGLLPELTSALAENVRGAPKGDRAERLQAAWKAYDELYFEEAEQETTSKLEAPSKSILSNIADTPFSPSHLIDWPVWNEESPCGTALLISNINFDLQAQLNEHSGDSSAKASRDRMFETLSSFVDPFVDPKHPEASGRDPQFSYGLKVWTNGQPRLITGHDKQFDRYMVEPMEHIIQGTVGADGIFRGKIKAFGEWLPEDSEIDPPKDLILSDRADIGVGPFEVFIASMEFNASNTTHSPAEFQHFRDLAERYAGFMMFRDGLRVMPYGRADNDFFEIESRRSRNAGREFWNHRQMFGRIAINRDRNPNLKDKAGREGLLDNRAAKSLKALVSNLLMQSARRYFGSASNLRGDLLPGIQKDNAKERAEAARGKLRKKQRQTFRTNLQGFSKVMPAFSEELRRFEITDIEDESQIPEIQQRLEGFRDQLAEFRLPGAPKVLGPLESAYARYREDVRDAQQTIAVLESRFESEMERISPKRPAEILSKQLSRNAAQIHHRTQAWKRSIEGLQTGEFTRVLNLIKERNKIFHAEATPLVHRVETGEIALSDASRMMETLRLRIDQENSELFEPYVGALESLRDSIDLEHIATFGMDELSDLRSELERLNSLAQLGIAVEIVGHELQSFDDIIAGGLRALPTEVRSSRAGSDIEFGYEGLTDQLRFLSPLRLAGQKVQKWITGEDVFQYLTDFFKLALAKNKVALDASDDFRSFRIFDEQSRLFPVFINLINNSIYWVTTSGAETRRIMLSVVGGEVVVSDNGPGIDAEDLGSLFTLFFTKKARGGRGVGLYLSRANLAAGGHRIRYEQDIRDMPLDGANFVINFRGAEFDAA